MRNIKTRFLLFLFCFGYSAAFSQQMKVSGTVQDTSANKPLQYAVAMAVKLSDSTLVKFTRTDEKGNFILETPIDTMEIIVSHPNFGEHVSIVVGSPVNHTFDFGKIILPPKSIHLSEITILGFKDPVYFKGDTLVYNTDSFKVKPNATVEDLLKKLPGMKVDAQGKISVQGKQIDQVLVDGDEFFGADPTVATKNLNATALQSVQVYEKKNENPAESDKEMLNILNLQLKEDAKKGYFGKISAASDFNKFYEGELLANKFKGSQKISVFALGTNTPRSRFGWNDVFKYGLNNDLNMEVMEDGSRFMYSTNTRNQGIPKTLKTGFYYSDKLSKKTKLTLNYTYNPNELVAPSETQSQYFFPDTSYINRSSGKSTQNNEAHFVNFSIEQALDSLTDLEISPKWKINSSQTKNYNFNEFISEENTLTRTTTTENAAKAKSYDVSSLVKLKRRFKKKERTLFANYNFNLGNNEAEGILQSKDVFFSQPLNDTVIDQQKTARLRNQTHAVSFTYTEPLSQKIKLEFTYDYTFNRGLQDKKTLLYSNGEYSIVDSLLTNDFENLKHTHRGGAKFIYETKKRRISVGARLRQIDNTSKNLITSENLYQHVTSILPNASFNYKFSDNQRMRIEYNANSTPPNITQLQPVPDNTDPNQIKLGNPNLLPTSDHSITLFYNSFKPLTERNLWMNASYFFSDNAFSNSIYYDSIGRNITQPINVKGNQRAWGFIGGEIPFFDKILKLNPNASLNYNKMASYINNLENTTAETTIGGGMDIDFELEDVELTLGGNYDYNYPTSTLSEESSKPYSSQDYVASFLWQIPGNFFFETEVTYNIEQRQIQGYDLNYWIWNATLSKTFLSRENLILSVEATDILNQNISNQRDVQDNVITDTKTNIIGRYIMMRLTFKFNSSKKKEENEEF